MVREALRGYLSLASGLSDVTAARARAAARALVEQGEATAGQVTALAEDLITTSRRNRESLALLVRHEVEQAVRRLGLAAAGDTEELTRRIRQLERTVRELQARSGQGDGRAGSNGARRTRTTAKSATATAKATSTAKRTPATRARRSRPAKGVTGAEPGA